MLNQAILCQKRRVNFVDYTANRLFIEPCKNDLKLAFKSTVLKEWLQTTGHTYIYLFNL